MDFFSTTSCLADASPTSIRESLVVFEEPFNCFFFVMTTFEYSLPSTTVLSFLLLPFITSSASSASLASFSSYNAFVSSS